MWSRQTCMRTFGTAVLLYTLPAVHVQREQVGCLLRMEEQHRKWDAGSSGTWRQCTAA